MPLIEEPTHLDPFGVEVRREPKAQSGTRSSFRAGMFTPRNSPFSNRSSPQVSRINQLRRSTPMAS
jgi:hypothetical protein